MKLTLDNIDCITYIYGLYDLDTGKKLLKSLIIDVDDFNKLLIDKNESYRQIYIDYEDNHTDYSCERTDPCIDYYGMFSLRFNMNPYETIGDIMTLEELDTVLNVLINFAEFKLS
jgi:hypothetical protein